MTSDAPNPDARPQTPDPGAADAWLTPSRFALVLAALLAVTFWRVLFGGEAFFYRDYGFLGYPFAYFHRECFWSGDFFPLWNPYVNCGAPFLAQWNTLCLYPGALLYLLLPLPWSLGFFCVAHLFLGGMGMRALAQRWTGSRFGAAVAGVAFVFSGLVLGCVIYPNYLVALGWMPWVVLATRRAWQEGGRSLVLAALAGAMQMLSGAPEIILLTWGFLAALLVLDWVQGSKSKVQSQSARGGGEEKKASSLTPALSRWEREGASATAESPTAPLTKPAIGDSTPKPEAASINPTQPVSPPLPAGEGRGEGERVPSETTAPPSPHRPTNHFSLITRFLSVIALITGLCAAQLLPFFQLLSLSQRSGDAVNTFWSLPGWGWVNLFFPLFMNFQTEQGVFVMIGQSFFPSVYLGIVPLTLALLAVWRIGLRRAEEPAVVGRGVLTPPPDTRTPPDLGGALGTARPTSAVWEVRLLGAATLLAVLLAMGDNFPLWGWLRSVLPLGVVRFPVKALLLAAFTVPLLAAWGIQWLETEGQRGFCAKPYEKVPGDEFWNPTLAPVATRSFKLVIFGVAFVGILVVLQMTFFPVGGTRISTVRGQTMMHLAFGYFFLCAGAFPTAVYGRNRLGTNSCQVALICLFAAFGVWHQPEVFNPTIPAEAFQPGLAADYHASKGALTPAPKLGEARIMLSPLAERALHTRMVPKFYDDFIGQRLAFWGNLNLLDGLPKVNGASTLVTREWNDVEYFLYGTTNPAPANLMDFLGVTHTTKPGELMQWAHRTNAMPLVSFAHEVKETNPGLSLQTMQRPDWNPRELTLLMREAPLTTHEIVCYFPRTNAPVPSGAIRVTRFGAARVELEIEANTPRGVVVAQNHYPSWQATVNGESASILKANHAFQAIPIPAGKSIVRLDYVDWPFRIGAGLSLLTLLGCCFLWRRARPSEPV